MAGTIKWAFQILLMYLLFSLIICALFIFSFQYFVL